MAPPALLSMAALMGTGRPPLAPAPSPPKPARAHVAAAPTARTARRVSMLCTPRGDDDVVDSGAGVAYAWPWGDEVPPAYVEEGFMDTHCRFVRESKEASAALKSAAADACSALVDNFHCLRSLKTVYDVEDYHIGMPFGAIIACIGCYQLWKLDPSTFLDVALGYAFYRLSVLASQVRRQGFSNDLFGRLKFVIVVIMAVKDIKKNLAPIDIIMTPVYLLYLMSFLHDLSGLKKYGKYYLAAFIELLKTEEGRNALDRIISKHLSA